MALSDKPGVLGGLGTIGTAIKQSTVTEVKKTVTNTIEQLSGQERKEHEQTEAQAAAQSEALRKQQSQEAVNWLYGVSEPPLPELPKAPVLEKKPETADIKAQLGLEQKQANTVDASSQLGGVTNIAEQLGMGQSGSHLTPEEQQKQEQLRQQLHNEYYQRLTNPQATKSDSDERIKEEQEEQETAQQRMERLQQEDLQEKHKEDQKKQPVSVDMSQNMEKHRGSSG